MAKILSLIILFALVCCVKLTLQQEEKSHAKISNCQYWSHYNNVTNTCDCGSSIHKIVKCKAKEGANTEVNVSVNYGYCFTLNKNSKEAIVGACSYNYLDCCTHITGSKNLSKVFCKKNNRTGQLCGQCVDGYSPPVYSYYAECVRCTPGTNNWPKYLAVALLPNTVFFIFILLFRFKATSPTLTGYILICQIIASPIVLRIIFPLTNTTQSILNPWYLQLLAFGILISSGYSTLHFVFIQMLLHCKCCLWTTS